MGEGLFPTCLCGDAGLDASFGERVSETVGVVSLIAEQALGRRQIVNRQGGALDVAHLTLAERSSRVCDLPNSDQGKTGRSKIGPFALAVEK